MGNDVSSPEAVAQPIPNEIKVNWEKISSNGTFPLPREGHSAAVIDKELIVFGGGSNVLGSGPQQFNDLHIFSIDDCTWKRVNLEGEIPQKRTGAVLVACKDSLILFGGLASGEDSSVGGWLNDMFCFDLKSKRWTKLNASGNIPSPRDKSSTVLVGNKLYLFGGFGPQILEDDEDDEDDEDEEGDEMEEDKPAATFGWFDDIYSFDIEKMIWTKESFEGKGPSARAAFGFGYLPEKNRIYVFGGRDISQRVNDLHVLDLTSNSWKTLPVYGQKPSPRSFHSFTLISNNSLLVFGGLDKSNTHLNDIHVLQILDNEKMVWLQPSLSTETIPSPRGFHSSTLFPNNKLLVNSFLSNSSKKIFGGSADFDVNFHESKTFHNDIYCLDVEGILKAPPVNVTLLNPVTPVAMTTEQNPSETQ